MSHRILIVEDDEAVLSALCAAIRVLGHAPIIARSGEEALQQLEHDPPALALIDVGLPGMSGYELVQRARALEPAPTTRLLAMTGWNRREDRIRAADAGFHGHLAKPVDLSTLRELLSALPAS
jgi:CheY-like chemotaxis protein